MTENSEPSLPPNAARLFALAQALTTDFPGFFRVQGPGDGDRQTAAYMAALRRRAVEAFGVDCAEQKICGPNGLCVDYFFADEEAIVEIALGLRNPLSEYERDILKALMAVDAGHRVKRLVFLSKPGAAQRLSQPGARAIAAWAERNHGLTVDLRELRLPRDAVEQEA